MVATIQTLIRANKMLAPEAQGGFMMGPPESPLGRNGKWYILLFFMCYLLSAAFLDSCVEGFCPLVVRTPAAYQPPLPQATREAES